MLPFDHHLEVGQLLLEPRAAVGFATADDDSVFLGPRVRVAVDVLEVLEAQFGPALAIDEGLGQVAVLHDDWRQCGTSENE